MVRVASPERLSVFSDGIFAVLITVLVLELRPPETSAFTAPLSTPVRRAHPTRPPRHGRRSPGAVRAICDSTCPDGCRQDAPNHDGAAIDQPPLRPARR